LPLVASLTIGLPLLLQLFMFAPPFLNSTICLPFNFTSARPHILNKKRKWPNDLNTFVFSVSVSHTNRPHIPILSPRNPNLAGAGSKAVVEPVEHGSGGGRAGHVHAWRRAFWWRAGVAAVGLSRAGLATEPRLQPGQEGAGGDVAVGVLAARPVAGFY
jgi:hypothetical protein